MQVQLIEPGQSEASLPVRVVPIQNPAEHKKKLNELIELCAFELYVSRGCQDGHAVEDWLEAETIIHGPDAQCPVGFIDLGNFIDVQAAVDGFKAEHLEVSVDPFCLMITGDLGKPRRRERPAWVVDQPQAIFRVLDLPAEIDVSQVTATLEGEMLHIMLPKKTRSQKRGASVRAA